ncbi:Glucuronate isomerase [Beutenbergia cavernae DSM 12333]|uniref:Uronate isomerase n=1 Tax=Beutenbergia cavernae (strain ATCC BAA-8 / DSM 12333 / CCUG 43141 / JCM 11478 / NBRC 16432 / NCIMB 13614 / HKI 0122) TaxID=471853 RepID=C5C1E5_BEUC1|nr:Glucuronate isomerase [Beutenbergia cavernae DSM 12333]
MALHPDRLFPADPATRGVARTLYAAAASAPIVSPHGHVDAGLLLRDEPFTDPADLLVVPDHYVLRLLHAHGADLGALGRAPRGDSPGADPREIWRTFCAHWGAFAGTPVRYWTTAILADVFGTDLTPSSATADALYDELVAALARPEFRPRALFERFGIEVLATTDDPADDLADHAALRDDPEFAGRVLPTFRPDAYLDPGVPGWPARLDRLGAAAGIDTGTHAGLVAALENRRAYFAERGATATDTGPVDAWALPLRAPEAERIHAAFLASSGTPEEATAYRRHMLFELMRMASEDGLVMQLHPSVIRNHHGPTLERYGPDTGHDLPDVGAFTRPLRTALEAFGTNQRFRLVLFTVDETTFSREIAPLAGFYPSVYAGAPWWFLDTPSAIARYRGAVTDSAGFGKTSGFIDDTRAFCSIPARHDMARRMDAGFLASLVVTHQLSEEEAAAIAVDLAAPLPRRVFRLE